MGQTAPFLVEHLKKQGTVQSAPSLVVTSVDDGCTLRCILCPLEQSMYYFPGTVHPELEVAFVQEIFVL